MTNKADNKLLLRLVALNFCTGQLRHSCVIFTGLSSLRFWISLALAVRVVFPHNANQCGRIQLVRPVLQFASASKF